MLSPTHLNNFLNIIDGGPMMFLEQNLLRFPQAKTASSVYGTAIHKALEDAHIMARKDGRLPKLETIISIFKKELSYGRLLDFEEEKLNVRGENVLTRYYELKKDEIKTGTQVEINFAKQSVMVDGALLTGKIDKVLVNNNKEWVVVDLKTGKGFSDWDEKGQSAYDEIKLHHYRYQLMMYKILVEHSRDYASHSVVSGVLEFTEEEMDVLAIAYDSYVKISTEVLEDIFAKVENSFGELYGEINAIDEKNFKAQLVSSAGKLGLDVDFFGRGFFPPGAYHSEGHQDSMGICLYLSLMKYLQGEAFSLAVLDDVMVSVDYEHRRLMAKILKKYFPATQFIITTHDKNSVECLREEGLIGEDSILEFSGWNIENGPTLAEKAL